MRTATGRRRVTLSCGTSAPHTVLHAPFSEQAGKTAHEGRSLHFDQPNCQFAHVVCMLLLFGNRSKGASPIVLMNSYSGAAAVDVMELLLDAICVVDTHGCFVSVTGACERIFGYSPEEMIGRPMLELVFPEDRAKTLQAVDKIMDGQLQRHFENRYVRKDGQIVHLMWSARWSETDQVRVAVARDVTERNHGEAMLAARQVATQAVPCWILSASPPRLIPPGFAPIALSSQDHTVMLALAAGGANVSRETIVHALGANYLHYDQRRLDTQIRRLRRKVKEACGLQLPLTTLRGIGYQFYEPIDVRR
jgi:PAS domain S-box-containing protein